MIVTASKIPVPDLEQIEYIKFLLTMSKPH